MHATRVQQFHHAPLMQPARKEKKSRSSLFASLYLGLTFNVSIFAVMGAKLNFISSTEGHALSAGAMVILIVFTFFRGTRFKFGSLPSNLKFALGGLLVCSFVLGLIGYANPDVPSKLKTTVLLKAGGCFLSLFALAYSVRVFNYTEIARALVLFSIVETVGCIWLYISGADVNPNAISVRFCVAAICVYSISPNKVLKIAALASAIGFAAALSCRTSAVALVGAVVFLYLEKSSRKGRATLLILTFAGATLTLIFLPVILSAMQQIAIQSLGSDNPIARFFLHDKSSAKISTDYLDRTVVWEQSLNYISKKPLLGYGIGTEQEIVGVRSHNAYLSLLFEGGVVWLGAWMFLYSLCISNLFNKKWVSNVGNNSMYYLTMLLLSYMLLAGIVETSGLASISTPNNLIFIFLTIWLFQPRPEG